MPTVFAHDILLSCQWYSWLKYWRNFSYLRNQFAYCSLSRWSIAYFRVCWATFWARIRCAFKHTSPPIVKWGRSYKEIRNQFSSIGVRCWQSNKGRFFFEAPNPRSQLRFALRHDFQQKISVIQFEQMRHAYIPSSSAMNPEHSQVVPEKIRLRCQTSICKKQEKLFHMQLTSSWLRIGINSHWRIIERFTSYKIS